MTTIDDLARTIRSEHGIGTLSTARDVAIAHVDQISDDPDLWNADEETLTPAGLQLVTESIKQSYETGQVATTAQSLLEQIAAERETIKTAEEVVAQHIARRDDRIRSAMRTELRRADIAAAAGLKEARLYQILDHRR